jgi:hypothetical protein
MRYGGMIKDLVGDEPNLVWLLTWVASLYSARLFIGPHSGYAHRDDNDKGDNWHWTVRSSRYISTRRPWLLTFGRLAGLGYRSEYARCLKLAGSSAERIRSTSRRRSHCGPIPCIFLVVPDNVALAVKCAADVTDSCLQKV